ncbi:MAG: hypothetical protein HY903_24860 [Deltaproteobacteria bacterium]|nr:hypothetical protein [Deltaproteobacteria bacterium]
MPTKANCWEYWRCERQEGGAKTGEFGVCPTSTEARLDGMHGGKNAGRSCWVIGGTFCQGAIQGSHAQKLITCLSCEFFLDVQQNEGEDFHMSAVLLEKLYGPKPKPEKPARHRVIPRRAPPSGSDPKG